MGRDTYSILHFPLISGIIGIDFGFEKIIGRLDALLTLPLVLARGGEYVLYVGFTVAAVWRASKAVLIPRLTILLFSLIGLSFSVGQTPFFTLHIIATSLLSLSAIEWKKCRHS